MTLEDIQNIKIESCPQFSVFGRDMLPMPGRKKRLTDILNRPIVITDFRVMKSKKRDDSDCLQIQFIDDGDVCVLFTGSSVLKDQIRTAATNIPFKCTIVQIDKYFSLS